MSELPDGDPPTVPATPGPAGAGHRAVANGNRRRFLAVVGTVGVALFGALAALCWVVADHNEQRLLQQQTDQASAVLSQTIGQSRLPLNAAAGAVRATGGTTTGFEAVLSPYLGDDGLYRTFELYAIGNPTPIARVGPPSELSTLAPDEIAAVLARTAASPVVVEDLLTHDRTLGFAVADDEAAPRFVVYGERRLGTDPNVRRQSAPPFAQLRYAIYLGDVERDAALLGSSERDLPLDGRRATALVPYGDTQLLLVTSPVGRLGDGLTAHLWWIVLVAGAAATAGAVELLRRLNRSRSAAVALADEQAMKHEEQRSIAETLQLGLLPQLLAVPPHTRIASRYWPAGAAQLIGGDFWDVFRIDDRRWGVLIGDVCGKGIEAAALTGLVRHTVRTAARAGSAPSDVLRAVHVAMADHQPSTFCTVCFMSYRPDDDTGPAGEVVISLGGHPQPLLARNGVVTPIGHFGTLLGMVDPGLREDRVRVEPGDTLVLFTDGLTDAPQDQAVPIADVETLLRQGDDISVDELADDIRTLKRRRRPSGSADDTALLVVRFEGATAVVAPAARRAAANV